MKNFTYSRWWEWRTDYFGKQKSIQKRDKFFDIYLLSDLVDGLAGCARNKRDGTELPLYKLKEPKGAYVTAADFGKVKLDERVEFREAFGGVCLLSGTDFKLKVRYVLLGNPRSPCYLERTYSPCAPAEINELRKEIADIKLKEASGDFLTRIILSEITLPTELNFYHALLPYVQNMFCSRFNTEFLYQIPIPEYKCWINELFQDLSEIAVNKESVKEAKSLVDESLEQHFSSVKNYVKEILDTAKFIEPLNHMSKIVKDIQNLGVPKERASYFAPYVGLPIPFLALEDLPEYGIAAGARSLRKRLYGQRLDVAAIYFILPQSYYSEPVPIDNHTIKLLPSEVQKNLKGVVSSIEEKEFNFGRLKVKIRDYKND